MEIVYFVSGSHPYADAIYFGVGPHFGAALGWRVESIDRISTCRCDVGVIDNRLEPADVKSLQDFLGREASRRFPIFFRISDPDMPLSENPCLKFIFACGDKAGVHFATTYDVEGPFRKFMQGLARSRVARLPYPYDRNREVDLDLADRRRRIFLSGASDGRLYPLRQSLRRKRRRNPFLRLIIHDLAHPGYPDTGTTLKHHVVRERFVGYAAAYTHFFLCPTVYESELAKYLECAYAGCVPLGLPPKSLAKHVKDCFFVWRGGTVELGRMLAADIGKMRLCAYDYRRIIRELRDPKILVQGFETEISAFL